MSAPDVRVDYLPASLGRGYLLVECEAHTHQVALHERADIERATDAVAAGKPGAALAWIDVEDNYGTAIRFRAGDVRAVTAYTAEALGRMLDDEQARKDAQRAAKLVSGEE